MGIVVGRYMLCSASQYTPHGAALNYHNESWGFLFYTRSSVFYRLNYRWLKNVPLDKSSFSTTDNFVRQNFRTYSTEELSDKR